MKRNIYICLLIVLFQVLAVGCNVKEDEQHVTITVSAAASLKAVMSELDAIYTKENPNVTLTINFGGSGALQQQIEQGAPADIFISASSSNMDVLEKKGLLVKGTRKDILGNEVVLITAKGTSTISGFPELISDKVKKVALGDPKSVPAGKYAQEVFTGLGIWDKIQAKSLLTSDVAQVLNYVATGNIEVGVVYQTDALTTDKVKVVAIAPYDSHKPVVYPIAVINSSKNQEAAKAFVSFLASDKSKPIYEKYGFKVNF